MNENESIGNSLIETIISSNVPDVASDLGEIALDSMLKDGTLRDVPVIGTLLGVAKTVSAFRDYFLLRKIISFLNGVKDVDPKARKQFAEEMENNPSHRQEIGGKLMVYIDRFDDFDKAAMLAKLFKAHLEHKISTNTFFRFASIVDRAYINDLKSLIIALSGEKYRESPEYAEVFYSLGLSEISFDDKLLTKHVGHLFDSSSHFPSSFDKFIKFKLTSDAYVLVQILSGNEIGGFDWLKVAPIRR
ncbi:MAG: hypothetical protein JNJ43_15960 [Anaerolineales bacterium]|nr:hypothetical protein [Anaerolineales bacterium]